MLTIQRKISKYNHYKNKNNIQYIVIHYTGVNYVDTAKNNVTYFASGDVGASAHYFVDSCSIWQSVEDCDGAWHCGDGGGRYGITNTNSLAIEMCCSGDYISNQTILNTLSLVMYLMDKYNVPASRVVRHYDASRKICPGYNFYENNWSVWNKFKEKVINRDLSWDNTIASNNVVASKNDSDYLSDRANYLGDRCLELQQKLIRLGYSCGECGADGKFGKCTYDALVKFQKDHNLTVDGYAGSNTFNMLNSLIYSNSNGDKWVIALQEECNIQGFKDKNGNTLNTDGKPGELTLSACPTLRYGSKGNITKLVQKKLNSLGFDCGVPDGNFGTNTYNAVVIFQSKYGLSADGIIGINTWRKLLSI